MNENLHAALVADYEARIATLTGDDLTEGEIELRNKAQAALDALKAETPTPPAPAAPAELTAQVELRRYVDAAASKRQLDGAELELNQELGLQSDLIPLSMLDKPSPAQLETRADTNTAITAGNFDANVRPVVIPAFAGSDLAHLGLTPMRVPNGQTRVPIITDTGAVATPVAKSGNVDADDAAVSVINFNALEVRKRFRYSRKETFEWGNRLDTALRDVLRLALAERLDDMAIAGTGTAPQPTGIFGSLTAPNNPSAESGFDDYVATPSGVIDGKWTNSENGMRMLVGIPTYKHARTKRQTVSGVSALNELASLGVSVRASGRVAAVVSKRQDALIALSPEAARSAYFVAVWNAFSLIRDETTYSANGDIALTATLWYDCKELIDGGIDRVRFQVAA